MLRGSSARTCGHLPGDPALNRARARRNARSCRTHRAGGRVPPSGQSLNRPSHRLCCCHLLLGIGEPVPPSPQPTPGPLNVGGTTASCTVGFFQSNPPLGHQPALAEPMPTLFLPLRRGSAANQKQPCCRVLSAIATGDACFSVAVATRERADSSPRLQAGEARSGAKRWRCRALHPDLELLACVRVS